MFLEHSDRAERFIVPENVTSIGTHAFIDLTYPVHIVFPETVEIVEKDAFYFEYDYDGKAVFFETKSSNIKFLGCPTNILDFNQYEEPRLISFIAPEDSCVHDFAKENGYESWCTFKDALSYFLSIAEEYEDIREEVADLPETGYYFERAEAAAHYGMKNGEDVYNIVSKFCRTAFNVTEHVRHDCFEEEEAIKLLIKYDLTEQYFEGQKLACEEFGASLVRLILALHKKLNAYPEAALLKLDADSVLEYIESLSKEIDYNIGSRNMFYDWKEDDYTFAEMFELGERLAELYIINRITGWEKILEAAKELLEEPDERYGYFSPAIVARWESMISQE